VLKSHREGPGLEGGGGARPLEGGGVAGGGGVGVGVEVDVRHQELHTLHREVGERGHAPAGGSADTREGWDGGGHARRGIGVASLFDVSHSLLQPTRPTDLGPERGGTSDKVGSDMPHSLCGFS